MMAVWGKRLLLVGVILGLLSGLAGCAGFGLFEKKQPVTIRFVFLENAADYQPLADEFQRQHSNITIELVPIQPYGNALRDLTERAAESDAVRVPAMALNDELLNNLLPLDTQVSTARDFPLNDLFPGVLEGLRLDGRQVAIPAGLNPYVMFYLPAKFTAAGIQPPNPNWTLEDFVLAATSINSTDENLRGTDRFTYGFCSSPNLPDAVMFAYLFGGALVDSPYRVSRPMLNSQANIDALAWYASLQTDFGLMPPVNNERELGRAVFTGNCAFWMDWMDRSTFRMRNAQDLGILPLPSYTSPFGVITFDVYSLLATTQHPEEAFQWITFLMNQQSAAGGLIPPLKSQVASEQYAARVSPASRAIARSLPQQAIVLGLEMYRDERFGTALELFGKATAEVMQGNTNVKSALDAAQMQAEEAFK